MSDARYEFELWKLVHVVHVHQKVVNREWLLANAEATWGKKR